MTRPAQCGRTFPHLPHDTEEGRCAGLPGVRRAGGPAPVEPPLVIRRASAVGDDPEVLNPEVLGGRGLLFLPPEATWVPLEDRRGEDPWEEDTGAGYDVRALRAGLRIIADLYGGHCEHFTTGLGSCWDAGRNARAKDADEQACAACIAWGVLGGTPLPAPPPDDIVAINVWRDHGDGHTTNLGRVSGITSLTYSDCARYACPEVPTREALTALLRDLDAPPSDTEPADPSVPVIITGGEGTVTVITPEVHEGRTIVILPGDTVVTYDGKPLVTQQDPA